MIGSLNFVELHLISIKGLTLQDHDIVGTSGIHNQVFSLIEESILLSRGFISRFLIDTHLDIRLIRHVAKLMAVMNVREDRFLSTLKITRCIQILV